MKRLSERLDYLENTNYNNNTPTRNNETETISWSPFDFKTIYDANYYLDINNNDSLIINDNNLINQIIINNDNDIINNTDSETECPALDLIANHYAEEEPSCNDPNTHTHNEDVDDDDDDDDDDMFEVIRIEPGSELDFSYSFSLPK